jgi:two-component system chemotaxis response regulator CheB
MNIQTEIPGYEPPPPRREFAVVAIAASAGGIPALMELLGGMPADFPVPIVVLQHLLPRTGSRLAHLLSSHTPLHVRPAYAGDVLEPGCVYVATPNHHLTVSDKGVIVLSDEKTVNWVRPSADTLFSSLAESFGDRAIVVVLTGTGRDGAAGAGDVDRAGGRVIAQDEDSAFGGMPRAAILATHVHQVLPLRQIAPTLVALAANGVGS